MEEISNSRPPRKHLTKEERLPRCYKDVEKVIRTVKSCQSNFKTVLANSRFRGSHFKKVYSMTVNVLKFYNYIQEIIKQTNLLEKEKFLKCELASVLIYEIIFGKGYLPGESKVVSIIQKYEKDIFNVHQMLQSSNPDKFITKEINVPRYVRVHTLVTTVAYVIKDLENLGFHQISYESDLSEEKYLDLIKNLEPGTFVIDFHFKDMLVFERSETLVHLDIYKNGHIFLQDKASYIPVYALNPEPGSAVLDACAAPGMKTIHIASKMKNKGILIACERDKARFESLKEMIQYGAVKIAKVFCKDFRSLDPNDQAYSTVESILLDPSCSGSGMVSRMDEVTDTEDSKNKERLMKLSGFQIILLKHALKFPSVKKVVYSTCSVHEEENENVVHEVLQQFNTEFKLVPVMPEWSERGSSNFEFGHLCVRTVPEKHLVNGFFVAMFERVEDNGYAKGMRFSKNKKFKTNPDASHDTEYDFVSKEQNIATSEWKKNEDVEIISDTFESYFNESNQIDENSVNLVEKKHKSPQKILHGFKNDSSLTNDDTAKRSFRKELAIEEFDHESNLNKKHKKKKKTRENSVEIHRNEELGNVFDILVAENNSNQSLKKESITEDFNNDSNRKKKHKKKTREDSVVVSSCHSNEEFKSIARMVNETSILTANNTANESLKKELAIEDFDNEIVIKKHKKKRKNKDLVEDICHPSKELTREIIGNETNILKGKGNFSENLDKEPVTENIDSENKKHKKKRREEQTSLTVEDTFCKNSAEEPVIFNIDCDSNVHKKHKKKRRKELNCEIIDNEKTILTSEDTFCENLVKEPVVSNIDHDSNLTKKHKKKKSKGLTKEIMGNETNILTVEDNCENLGKELVIKNIDHISNVNKKHKKKRIVEDSVEILHPDKELTNVLLINENSIDNSKENLKHKKIINDFDHPLTVDKKHKKKRKDSDKTLCRSIEQEINESFENKINFLPVKKKHKKSNLPDNVENMTADDASTHKLKKKKKKHSEHETVQEEHKNNVISLTEENNFVNVGYALEFHKDNVPLKGKKRKHLEHQENVTGDSKDNEQYLKCKKRRMNSEQ